MSNHQIYWLIYCCDYFSQIFFNYKIPMSLKFWVIVFVGYILLIGIYFIVPTVFTHESIYNNVGMYTYNLENIE